MAEIDAFFDAVRLTKAGKYQGRVSVIAMKSVKYTHKPTVCLLENPFPVPPVVVPGRDHFLFISY
jgi:hypothetical protein